MTTVRYLVNDVDRAVGFHTGSLGFALKQQFGGDGHPDARRYDAYGSPAGRVHRAADADGRSPSGG